MKRRGLVGDKRGVSWDFLKSIKFWAIAIVFLLLLFLIIRVFDYSFNSKSFPDKDDSVVVKYFLEPFSKGLIGPKGIPLSVGPGKYGELSWKEMFIDDSSTKKYDPPIFLSFKNKEWKEMGHFVRYKFYSMLNLSETASGTGKMIARWFVRSVGKFIRFFLIGLLAFWPVSVLLSLLVKWRVLGGEEGFFDNFKEGSKTKKSMVLIVALIYAVLMVVPVLATFIDIITLGIIWSVLPWPLNQITRIFFLAIFLFICAFIIGFFPALRRKKKETAELEGMRNMAAGLAMNRVIGKMVRGD